MRDLRRRISADGLPPTTIVPGEIIQKRGRIALIERRAPLARSLLKGRGDHLVVRDDVTLRINKQAGRFPQGTPSLWRTS
ncbi:hypothetical protein [Bradyrhizobium liaoningense]|uniref:hypothetical protein n=1 Tax=Bradyrhizobium liaoningense TaxID=43992 RepID=UPI001BAC24D4|nr:hypothetical protein [Bradyrhizobium liaoningense]MBR0713530.1 hypothetical protein [Bradyrhizobium liaoningense]